MINQKEDKICSSKIKIGAKISITGIIKASVDIIKNRADKESAVSSGDYGNAVSSGDYGNAVSSGDYGNAASSGYKGNAASSGYCSNAVSSGNCSNAVSSGYCSNAVSSGNKGTAKAEHKNVCATAWGPESKASGVIGSHLVLSEWKLVDDSSLNYWEEGAWEFVCATIVRVDGRIIKEKYLVRIKKRKGCRNLRLIKERTIK